MWRRKRSIKERRRKGRGGGGKSERARVAPSDPIIIGTFQLWDSKFINSMCFSYVEKYFVLIFCLDRNPKGENT